ncbi:MAG TPA: hypothetical protein VK184_05840 [Nostocaceae cyanobacterium]|nr:hypothetical protein [Nostocaceae cyanobacterium]
MYVEQILQTKVTAVNKLYQVKQSELKQDNLKNKDFNFPDLALSLSPLSFVFVWAIFLLILQKIRSNLDEKLVLTINGLQKVPCKNCKYFSNNHYLKCAVQPHLVMTEEAINCSEYSPKKGSLGCKKFPR